MDAVVSTHPRVKGARSLESRIILYFVLLVCLHIRVIHLWPSHYSSITNHEAGDPRKGGSSWPFTLM